MNLCGKLLILPNTFFFTVFSLFYLRVCDFIAALLSCRIYSIFNISFTRQLNDCVCPFVGSAQRKYAFII